MTRPHVGHTSGVGSFTVTPSGKCGTAPRLGNDERRLVMGGAPVRFAGLGLSALNGG